VQGKTISVVTSLGPPPVPVPALASITAGGCPAVTAVLSSGHLKPLCAYDTSISVKDGGVISFTPDVKTAIWGTTIRVVISTGLPQVAVPDIAGMSKDELTNALNVAHFTVAFGTAQYSSTVPTGEPLPGWTGEGKTLLYGSTVGVVLSLGHAPVAVPNVAGDSQTEAVDMLESEGFTISAVYGPNDDPVTSTDPLEGTVEPYGYAVDVYLGPPA
jgi:serine/threonine-protein kinase